MLSKLHLFFLFVLFSVFAEAQNIRLQKNETLKKREIKLCKGILIEYSNAGTMKIVSGKAFRYEFPFLFLKTKSDTLQVDVRNIKSIGIHHQLEALNVTGAILAPFITTLFLLDIASGVAFPLEKILFLPGGVLSYYCIKAWPHRYNTETEWSFY